MNITLITGAGCSNNFLFTNDIKSKLTKKYFLNNPKEVTKLLLDFRHQCQVNSTTNEFYLKVSELQKSYNINIITQNVDNQHSINSNVIEMHGNIFNDRTIWNWFKRYTIPDVVLYDEPIRGLYRIMDVMLKSDINIFIGTSLNTETVKSFIKLSDKKSYWIEPTNITSDLPIEKIQMDALSGIDYIFKSNILI
jgi:NAD-dependent deacetylase